MINILLEKTNYLSTKWWGQLLLITLASVFIMLSHLLLGFRVIAELDISYPFFTLFQDTVRNYTSPLINNFALNDTASYADTHTGLLSPINFCPAHYYRLLLFG